MVSGRPGVLKRGLDEGKKAEQGKVQAADDMDLQPGPCLLSHKE